MAWIRLKTELSKPNSITLMLRMMTETNEMTVKCRRNGEFLSFIMLGSERGGRREKKGGKGIQRPRPHNQRGMRTTITTTPIEENEDEERMTRDWLCIQLLARLASLYSRGFFQATASTVGLGMERKWFPVPPLPSPRLLISRSGVRESHGPDGEPGDGRHTPPSYGD